MKIIKKMIPERVKLLLKSRLRAEVMDRTLINPVHIIKYFPYHLASSSYQFSKAVNDELPTCKLGLPIPPKHLLKKWFWNLKDEEEWLLSGESTVKTMIAILQKSGFSLSERSRILEFGCAEGRLLRWLKNLTETCEIWGADINAEDIAWCQQYLSPPFNFFTTTTLPHLPFEDRYFDFIYAGSVFTHIDDLAIPWLLELRRIMKHQGLAYITIHDRHDLSIGNNIMYRRLRSHEKYVEYTESGFGMFTINRNIYHGGKALIFYDIDYFCQMVKSFFKVISVTEEAYQFQTAVLLQKVD